MTRGTWAKSKAREVPTRDGLRELWERMWIEWDHDLNDLTRQGLARDILNLREKHGTPTYYAVSLVDKARYYLLTEWAKDIPK